jgi:DNA-binding NarL/FixJ family response regulator
MMPISASAQITKNCGEVNLSRPRHRRKLIIPIRLTIGCSSYLSGEGIKKILQDEKGIEVIAIFNKGVDFKEIIKMKPDIAILDFKIFRDLPNDLEVDIKIKILLMGESGLNPVADRQIVNLLSKGAVGILPAGADSFLLKKAIKAVSSGELWLDRKTLSTIISYDSLAKNERFKLTKAEKEIVFLICEGFRNKEIAKNLNVSEKTVKSHCNRIYKKVGVKDRLQLATYIYKVWPDWYTAKN